jgi:hypothetical protein
MLARIVSILVFSSSSSPLCWSYHRSRLRRLFPAVIGRRFSSHILNRLRHTTSTSCLFVFAVSSSWLNLTISFLIFMIKVLYLFKTTLFILCPLCYCKKSKKLCKYEIGNYNPRDAIKPSWLNIKLLSRRHNHTKLTMELSMKLQSKWHNLIHWDFTISLRYIMSKYFDVFVMRHIL